MSRKEPVAPSEPFEEDSDHVFVSFSAMHRAVEAIEPRPDLDLMQFELTLRGIAYSYLHFGRSLHEVPWRPSEAERHWHSLANRAESLHEKIKSLPDSAFTDLHVAAGELAERREKSLNDETERGLAESLQDIPDQNRSSQRVRPIERRVAAVREHLDWFTQCCRLAEAAAAESKRDHGAPSKDKEKYDLVQMLDQLYRIAVVKPRNPYVDRIAYGLQS